MADNSELWQMIYDSLSERDLARFARFMTISVMVKEGDITPDDGRLLLKGNLSPDDDSTYQDDSAWIDKTGMEVIDELLSKEAG